MFRIEVGLLSFVEEFIWERRSGFGFAYGGVGKWLFFFCREYSLYTDIVRKRGRLFLRLLNLFFYYLFGDKL